MYNCIINLINSCDWKNCVKVNIFVCEVLIKITKKFTNICVLFVGSWYIDKHDRYLMTFH